jgi:hypothetical protein
MYYIHTIIDLLSFKTNQFILIDLTFPINMILDLVRYTLYFDPTLPRFDESMFAGAATKEQFKEQYRDANEELPDHMPVLRGRQVEIFTFVDASHASN